MIALIVSAGWNIAHHTVRTKTSLEVASAAAALGLARVNTIWILLAAGALWQAPIVFYPPPVCSRRGSESGFFPARKSILVHLDLAEGITVLQQDPSRCPAKGADIAGCLSAFIENDHAVFG